MDICYKAIPNRKIATSALSGILAEVLVEDGGHTELLKGKLSQIAKPGVEEQEDQTPPPT